MKIVTVGMINAFCECPQKYKYIFEEHLEIPVDDSYAETGKKIHALINYFLKRKDISKMLKALEEAENNSLKNLWNNFEKININNVLASEYTFNVILDDKIKLSGRIDAIFENNNHIEIADWKTGKSSNISPENEVQTIVYLYSVFKLFKKLGKISKPEQLSLTYFFLKENVSETVKFSQEKYDKYEKFLLEKTEKILNVADFNIYPKEKCNECSFKIVCQRAFS